MVELFKELDEDENLNISKPEMEVFLSKLIFYGTKYNLQISSVSDTTRYSKVGDIIAN